jgi:prepilin-type N-terminal cleavage/methylation domain-containing protein
MNRISRRPRRGFTLIELLVVIGIMLVLASLALFISPRVAEDQRTVRGADLISGWLLVSKQRAIRDQAPRGIRLVPGPDSFGNNAWANQMVYIERPVDYRPPSPAYLVYPAPQNLAAQAAPAPLSATVFIAGKDLTNASSPGNPIVSPGDYLVFDTLEVPPYNSHCIWNLWRVQGGTLIALGSTDGTYYGSVNNSTQTNINPVTATSSTTGPQTFRFVRSSRPLIGEPVLQLPRDIIVDLAPAPGTAGWAPDQGTPGPTLLPAIANLPGPPINQAGDAYDIVFSPRGVILGNNGTGGKVILRVRNSARPPTDGDQLYVTVYTAGGTISTHPVNLANPLNYYSFTQDGYSSGY